MRRSLRHQRAIKLMFTPIEFFWVFTSALAALPSQHLHQGLASEISALDFIVTINWLDFYPLGHLAVQQIILVFTLTFNSIKIGLTRNLSVQTTHSQNKGKTPV